MLFGSFMYLYKHVLHLYFTHVNCICLKIRMWHEYVWKHIRNMWCTHVRRMYLKAYVTLFYFHLTHVWKLHYCKCEIFHRISLWNVHACQCIWRYMWHMRCIFVKCMYLNLRVTNWFFAWVHYLYAYVLS